MRLRRISEQTKIIAGFLSILGLLLLVSGVAFNAVGTARDGFTEYREMARDTNLTGRLQANMLMVRMNVKDFIITGSYRDMQEYADYYRRMATFLEEAQEEIGDPERAALIDTVEADLGSYVDGFDRVIQLREARDNAVHRVLDVKGPFMETSLTGIMISAQENDDMSAAFHAGLAMKHLLLARLYVSKFLVDNNQVAVGFVIALDYQNPYLSPFDEFQRYKTHPDIACHLEGGKRISYGARAINEGGLQSIPNLIFPGGALMGCSAGFVNVPKIKGSHNAIKTGMLAAEAAFAAIQAANEAGQEMPAALLEDYPVSVRESWVWKEMTAARNFRPAFAKWGLIGGTLYNGFDQFLGGNVGWTLSHPHADYEGLKPKDQCKEIDYPKPDGVFSFDKPSSVFISNTNHEEDQPVHLKLTDPNVPVDHNLALYDAPEQRYCPAGVYEILTDDDGSNPRLQINGQNCLHCKTCDIKDPTQNITWTVPEGTGGPNYPNM